MLKGKYCMKKRSRLDPDHFLSLALPCPRSLILQQLNIFKVFSWGIWDWLTYWPTCWLEGLGLRQVGLLSCVLAQNTFCVAYTICAATLWHDWIYLFSHCLSLSTQNWVQVSENCQRKQLKCWRVTCDGLAFHSGRE